jgi:hypothetical protein
MREEGYYAHNATCYYWFEIDYAAGTAPVQRSKSSANEINIAWNYESYYGNATSTEGVAGQVYKTPFCPETAAASERLSVTVGVDARGTPCTLMLTNANTFDDFDQLFSHLGINFAFMLLMVCLVFWCARGEYGYAYQEMFIRHPFSPPAQGTKLLDLACAYDDDASPEDRVIEKLLRPGAKIRKGTWRDTWYLCNEVDDDDDDDDDNAPFDSPIVEKGEMKIDGKEEPSNAREEPSNASYDENDDASIASTQARRTKTHASRTKTQATKTQASRRTVLPPSLPPLPFTQRVNLFLNTRFDSIAFREVCGVEAVSQLRLGWYLVQMTLTISVLSNAMLLPINVIDFLSTERYGRQKITIAATTITYAKQEHLWVPVLYTFLLTVIVVRTIYFLFVDYISTLREIRTSPWHSVGRRTLLIRRGLAKTATTRQLRDFVECVLRLEWQSFSERESKVQRATEQLATNTSLRKRRPTEQFADGDGAEESDEERAVEPEAETLHKRSHFVQQVMLVSPMHNPRKSDFQKKLLKYQTKRRLLQRRQLERKKRGLNASWRKNRGYSVEGVELPDVRERDSETRERDSAGAHPGAQALAQGLEGSEPEGMTEEQRLDRKEWRMVGRWKLPGWADEREDQIQKDTERRGLKLFVQCCPGDNCCPSPTQVGKLYWRVCADFLNGLQYCSCSCCRDRSRKGQSMRVKTLQQPLLKYEHKAGMERDVQGEEEDAALLREVTDLRVWLLEEMEQYRIPTGDDESDESDEDDRDEADGNMATIIEGDYYKREGPLEVNGNMKVNGCVYKNAGPIVINGDLWVKV